LDQLFSETKQYDAPALKILEECVERTIEAIGEDHTREGLAKTPSRVAKSTLFLTQGYAMDARAILSSALFEEENNQMILVRDIELFSLCEHHMIPFYGKAHVAYIPDGRIVGLSKLARVVDVYARRLQVQERLTLQIKDALSDVLRPQGVAVIIEATHLCMVMRGVQKQHSVTTTSAMSGVFLENANTRSEFMRLISNS
jgi:GTP cyclohydrolase I